MGKGFVLQTPEKAQADILNKVKKHLRGRTIVDVRYMTNEEVEKLGWYKKGIVIILDNREILYPMQDEEANDSGVIGTSIKQIETIGRF